MKTLADKDYVAEALKALSECFTELELVNWDDRYASNEQYMHLSTLEVDRLESEYRKRVAFVLGGLA